MLWVFEGKMRVLAGWMMESWKWYSSRGKGEGIENVYDMPMWVDVLFWRQQFRKEGGKSNCLWLPLCCLVLVLSIGSFVGSCFLSFFPSYKLMNSGSILKLLFVLLFLMLLLIVWPFKGSQQEWLEDSFIQMTVLWVTATQMRKYQQKLLYKQSAWRTERGLEKCSSEHSVVKACVL